MAALQVTINFGDDGVFAFAEGLQEMREQSWLAAVEAAETAVDDVKAILGDYEALRAHADEAAALADGKTQVRPTMEDHLTDNLYSNWRIMRASASIV